MTELDRSEPLERHWSEDNGRALILLPLSSPQAATAAQWDGARPPIPQMIAFIKDHRAEHGVEPICRVLQIAPSTFYERLAIKRDPYLAQLRQRLG